MTRLDHLNRQEWEDVARHLRPNWTLAKFDAAWKAFQHEKMKRTKI